MKKHATYVALGIGLLVLLIAVTIIMRETIFKPKPVPLQLPAVMQLKTS